MKGQFSEVVQSSFSIIALLGIIVVSSFVVLNLNPVALQEDPQLQGPRVAGLSTNIQSLSFINTAGESAIYRTELKAAPELVAYKATFSKADLTMKDNFIKVQNASDSTSGFSIKAIVPTNLSKIIKVSLSDSVDLIYLNDNQPKRVTLDPRSERSFQVTYSLTRPINFGFQIDFEITN